MGAKTTAAATSLLNHILNNLAWTSIGDAPGLLPSATTGVLWLGLHTADPGVGGNQTTNELAYTGSGRISVARDGTQWSVVGNTATNLALLTFAACAGGGGTATFVGIGTDAAGAGNLLYRATITFPVAGLLISPGITPLIQIGAATVIES